MTRNQFNSELDDETHTKRGRARLAKLAVAEFGLPLTFRATSESGDPRAWACSTPADVREFVAGASSKLEWRL